MGSWKSLVSTVVRLIVDFISDVIFGLIYRNEGKRIECVKDPILFESAVSLAEKIRKKKIKSIDIVEKYIARIKEVQPIINAVSEDRFEKALEDAKRVDELIKSEKYSDEELERQFPYLGVPFTVKESFAVEGMLNTAGLVMHKGTRASDDANTVALMRKAGGIPLANTNVPELCMWWETHNNIYGRSSNPYDTRRITGGSSGGEAAIIGAGGSVIGIGSDIGGSIRMPAFFCGIFGHKPSKGIVSNEGQLPKTGDLYKEFLTTGPMCRYAEDLLPMLKVLAGENVSKLDLDKRVPINKLNIYYMEQSGETYCTPVNSELKQAQEKVLKYFEETYGIKSQNLNFKPFRYSEAIWTCNLACIKAPSFSSYMVEKGKEFNGILEVLKWILRCSNHTLPCICYALYEAYEQNNGITTRNKYTAMAAKLRKEFNEILGDNGIFLYPSHPELAIYHNQTLLKSFNFSYTAIFNVLGVPVTQCPLGLSSKGLPLGIQVVAGLRNDHLTLLVAKELEKAFGGWQNPHV